jgi:hypothetical protein
MAMIDYTFHPKYVEPYYLLLMNANFIRDPEKAPDLFRDLRQLSLELDNSQLSIMLKSSWRPSKVAAWIIGLAGKKELEEDLIQLMKYNASYCEHAIFALTLLDVESKVLEEYITDQIRKSEALPVMDIERFSFAWAIAALDWLSDKKRNDVRSDKFTERWQSFIVSLETRANKAVNINIDDMLKLAATRKNFYHALQLVELNK